MVALVDDWIDGKKLSQQWEAITGDSKIVDVRRLKPSKGTKDDYMEAFIEVFKYALNSLKCLILIFGWLMKLFHLMGV